MDGLKQPTTPCIKQRAGLTPDKQPQEKYKLIKWVQQSEESWACKKV
jgi:hypothetical protein